MARSGLGLLLAVPALWGCAAVGDASIDVAVNEAAPGLPTRLQGLSLRISAIGDDGTESLARTVDALAEYDGDGRLRPWTVRTRAASQGQVGRTLFRFRAVGLVGSAEYVSAQARLVYVPARRVVLVLRFDASCVHVACAPTQTCSMGACVDDYVPACELVEGLRPGYCDDAGVPSDADVGMDARPRVDGGPPPSCTTSAGCPDDGLACTAPAACMAGFCRASVVAGSCLVDGVCYASGQANPGNSCLACDPTQSTTTWTPHPESSCDDDVRCTLGDSCDAMGVCRGSTRSCPAGMACQESTGACAGCTPSGPEVCDGADNDCNGLADDVTPSACSVGVGACLQSGTRTCAGCDAMAGSPAPEACNGVDDDCDGNVDPPGTCGPAPECAPDGSQRDLGGCGNCGTSRQTCSGGRWQPPACVNQGECSPPSAQDVGPCGNCGTGQRVCQPDCRWSATPICVGEGECVPGSTTPSAACDPCSELACDGACHWSFCALRPGAECEWRSGGNWRCCAPSSWQFCLPDACVWSTDCVDCTAGGCGC